MPTRDIPWPTGTPCWVDIMVPDVDAAADFYGSVLGWSFVDTGPDFGHFRICQAGGRAAGGLGEVNSPDQPVAWTVYLASPDIEATNKLIVDNGGSVVVGPMDVGDVCRFTIASDPTGAVFGAFQAKDSPGIEVYNEPGGLVWEDARLTDVPVGRRFYQAVFDLTYAEIPGMSFDEYGTFSAAGAEAPAGGMGSLMGAPEGTPSHWLPYLSVADIDAAVATVRGGGGGVLMAPETTPFGRIGVVTDPFGAPFGMHTELAQS